MHETSEMKLLLAFPNLSNYPNIICSLPLSFTLSLSLSLGFQYLCNVYLSKYVLGQNRTAVWAVGNVHTHTHTNTQAAKSSLILEELWSGSLS